MNKKIFLLFILVFVLTFSFAFASSFKDLKDSHWAYETIELMAKKGYLKGYPDGTFKPDGEVTREEFLQILYNVNNSPKATNATMQNYYDVKDTRWSYNAVQVYGYSLKETSDGYTYFYPTKAIERQEVAKILNDVYKLDLTSNDLDKSDFSKFEDTSMIKKEYETAVANVYNSGLMVGMSDTEFSPHSSLTRAQASTLVARIIKLDEEPIGSSDGKDLDLEFLRLENKKENIIYSPLSIKTALLMLGEGAKARTKEQIDSLVTNYNLKTYNSNENLSFANSIFIRDIYKDEVLQSYIDTLKNKYDAEVFFDSFTSAAPINNWISNKTFKLINNLLTDDAVTPKDSVLFLINALAIDMKWDNAFNFEQTYGRKFYKDDGKEVVATTMLQEMTVTGNDNYYNPFNYYMDDEIQAITKDLKTYDDIQLQYVAVMPKNKKLNEYVKDFSSEDIKTIREKVLNNKQTSNTTTNVKLFIPKYEYDYTLNFMKDLKDLGMVDAFDSENANFFNMFDEERAKKAGENYYVSQAIHKAKVEFTEEGIKAAAVTVFGMSKATSIGPMIVKNVEIRFDHPFLFFIVDKENGEVWFTGTVYSPNLWEKDSAEYAIS